MRIRHLKETVIHAGTVEGHKAVKELRVVIADDNSAIRQQLQRALSRIDGLVLLGMAENGVEAIPLIKALNPDVVILDISMPLKNGLEVLREVRRENSTVKIIMFTAESSELLKNTCLELGADHFLNKSDLTALTETCQGILLQS